MKRYLAIGVLISVAGGAAVRGQGTVAPPSGGKSLAATLNVYAFPTKGQSSSQQSEDEAACYQYAQQQTGVDPFTLQKQSQQQAQQTAQAEQQAQQAGKGAGAAGAVGGAAAGALIGELVSDSAGAGAAYGAAAGLIIGRRRAQAAQAQATQQAQQQGQQSQQQIQQEMTNFKKAFSVCLQAKGYMVQY
jgi:hypothetical protein